MVKNSLVIDGRCLSHRLDLRQHGIRLCGKGNVLTFILCFFQRSKNFDCNNLWCTLSRNSFTCYKYTCPASIKVHPLITCMAMHGDEHKVFRMKSPTSSSNLYYMLPSIWCPTTLWWFAECRVLDYKAASTKLYCVIDQAVRTIYLSESIETLGSMSSISCICVPKLL